MGRTDTVVSDIVKENYDKLLEDVLKEQKIEVSVS